MKKLLFVLLAFLISSTTYADTQFRGITLSPEVTSDDIDDLVTLFSGGAPNVVRHQLFDHSADNENESEYMLWLSDALDHLDEMIPVYQANNMKVVIDLHTPPGGFVDSSAYPAIHKIFTESWAQAALITVWQTIAQRYNGNSTVYGYLLVNEPAEPSSTGVLKNWSTLASDTAQAIRAIDNTTPIIVLPRYANPSYISKLVLPLVSGIVLGVHFYPFLDFNQQGIYGNTTALAYPTKGKKSKKTGKIVGGRNKKTLKEKFAKVASFIKKNPTIPVAVMETAQSRFTEEASYLNYIEDLFNMFEKNGVDYLFHAWREDNTWSIEHDSDPDNNDPVAGMTDRAALIQQYYMKN